MINVFQLTHFQSRQIESQNFMWKLEKLKIFKKQQENFKILDVIFLQRGIALLLVISETAVFAASVAKILSKKKVAVCAKKVAMRVWVSIESACD